jgi:hypothetical protein
MNNDILNILHFKESKNNGLSTLRTNKEKNIELNFSIPNLSSSIKLNSNDKSFNINLIDNNLIKIQFDNIISKFQHQIPTLNILDQINTSNFIIENKTDFKDSVILTDIIFNKDLHVSNIIPLDLDKINIIAKKIILGNSDTIIYIEGTLNYIDKIEINLSKKIINLNLSNDKPSNCGIIIGSNTLDNGYILTSDDDKHFIIKPPVGIKKYIAIMDSNYNFDISGNTILNESNINNILYTNQLYVTTLSILNNISINMGTV